MYYSLSMDTTTKTWTFPQIVPTYIARKTIVELMTPAIKALFLALWREGAQAAFDAGYPLAGERGAAQHEDLADYVLRLVQYVQGGQSGQFALNTTRVPANFSAYVRTPNAA